MVSLLYFFVFSLVSNLFDLFRGDYIKLWKGFTIDVREKLEEIIVSFKQNNRVINKTNNKTWQWCEEGGELKKKLVLQSIGDNWAIRKPLHKETVSGILNWKISNDKIVTASRASLSSIKNTKLIEKITDSGIRKILYAHIKNYTDKQQKTDFELAFSSQGIEELNKNISQLNNGKFHQPIYSVRLFEESSKFNVGSKREINKKKFVEAAKGTNLFFAIYWNKEKEKREFETIPLIDVIDHQKWRAALPKEEMKQTPMIPISPQKGKFLFSLSPNDLVYVPTDDELEFSLEFDFEHLDKNRANRIYKMISCTGNELHFLQHRVANLILPYNAKTKIGEFGSLNKSERDIDGIMIKERCIKLNIDRLGNISKAGTL